MYLYSGSITLELNAGEATHLSLEADGVACITLCHPQESASEVLPWAPFTSALAGLSDAEGRVLAKFTLTRRNTFGPLHLIPMRQVVIDPQSFRSSGERWSDDYQLEPVGLTQATCFGAAV